MLDNAATFRILDANLNRAREGLRVVEEYARFALDDAGLTARLKSLRHELRAAADTLHADFPHGSSPEQFRDLPGDVGATVTTNSERTRENPQAVARASLKRLQESLRALEEYGKTLSPAAAARFERLRYGAYAIETAVFADREPREKLRAARLYVLVTESLASTDAVTAAREAVAGGADIIQLREKEIEDGACYERALELGEICREGGALFLLNDRAGVAALAGADGIHTGWGDLPIHLARRLLGPDRIIGRSTNAPELAARALAEGADYLGVGPVFPTNTKKHRAAVGLEYVRYAVEKVNLPFFCIGSINRENLGAVLEAGARAVAICTAIIGAKDIAAETAWFKERLLAVSGSPR